MCTNPTASSVTLVWSPPSDNGGEIISHYEVTGTPDDISIITTMTSITVSDLTPLTEYTFTVRANNTLGFSNSSVDAMCTTRGEGKIFSYSVSFWSIHCYIIILVLLLHVHNL